MIAALLLLADPTPVLAVPPAVFAGADVAGIAPRLDWPAGTDLRIQGESGDASRGGGDELVAHFDRPLPTPVIEAFRDHAGAALDDLRWNDDSLVLRAAPGWTMRWRRTGSGVTIAFAPQDVPAPASDASLDFDMARVEADAAAGYAGAARRGAERLAAGHPGDARVARLLADARAGDGDTRGAAHVYGSIGADDMAARRTMAAAPGTVAAGMVVRSGGDLRQVEASARADVAIDDRLSIGAGARHVASRVAGRGGGGKAGTWFADAALGLSLEGAARAQILLSSSLDDGVTGGVTGGGARATIGSAEAQLRAVLLIHMPDVSTGAQALAGGWLSRAAVAGSWRLSPSVVVLGEAGANRYGLAGDARASATTTLAGGLDWLLHRGSPSLTLGYRVEAEYVGAMRRGIDCDPLIALATRENHVVQGVASGAIGDVQLTGQLGYTVDRFGGNGPVAAMGVNAAIGQGWRIDGGGGVTAVSRAGFTGTQVFGRAQLTRGLGR